MISKAVIDVFAFGKRSEFQKKKKPRSVPRPVDDVFLPPARSVSVLVFTVRRYRFSDPDGLPAKVLTTAEYRRPEKPPSLVHTVTFLSKNTYVGLPALRAYSRTDVYFRFKTKHAAGVLFYNGGEQNDFVLAELVNGHVVVNVRSGTHAIRLRDASANGLGDNYWHSVHVLQVSATTFCLLVDDRPSSAAAMSRPHNMQLDGTFYVGE